MLCSCPGPVDMRRTCLPFSFWLDFEFCTEEELSHSGVAEEYRRFCYRFGRNTSMRCSA
ncbi:MAG: hypothetical protein ACLTYN_02290 [Dysosmobacter welbionis]